MPRFHFNIDDSPDIEGQELSGLDAAKCKAVNLFGLILCDDAQTFWDRAEWSMTVTDHRALTLFQLHIFANEAAAIPLRRQGQQNVA